MHATLDDKRKARGILKAIAGLMICLAAPGAMAHGVHAHAIEGGYGLRAVFSNGEPMAFAEVTVYAPETGDEIWQRGTTDRQGNFLFMPDRPGTWRMIINDGLGHAVQSEITVDEDGVAHVEHVHGSHAGIWQALAGLGLLFGLFGIWSLARSRRPETSKQA